MKVIEIAFTVYPVSDLKRSRDFYEGVLGLTLSRKWGDETKGMVEYDIGPGTFAIGAGAEQFVPSKTGASVAFEVEDFPAAMSRLRERHCQFVVEPMETPVCHMAIVLDPDGSSLLVHKRKAA